MTLTTAPTQLTIRPTGTRIGAVIEGVRLSGDLPEQTVAEIRAALVQHKVVFFRNQHLDDATHRAFAARLGTVTPGHPTVQSSTDGAFLTLESAGGRAANSWHTDVTFIENPPAFSVLRGLEIPEYGGNTLWANTEAAYDDLPEALRSLVDNLWAVHTNDYDYADAHDGERRYLEDFTRILFETRHPVVRVHPESGRRSLLLGHFVKQFVGLKASESQAIFQLLQARVTRPENTARWVWSTGDVVIWDNRATQHYAIADFDQPRAVRRVTVAGDIPVSVDGRTSEVITGDASGFVLDDLIS